MPIGLRILLPDWIVAWIAIAAVVAFILGYKRTAIALGLVPVGRWIIMPLVMPLLQSLPGWVLPAAIGAIVLVFLLVGPRRLFGFLWVQLTQKRR